MSSVAREFVEAVLLALVVFLVIQTSVQNFRVEGSSMYPTLQGGQYLLVNKVVYLRIDENRLSRLVPFWDAHAGNKPYAIHPPHRGDVIVFQFPRDPGRDFVKRVIGLPGEQVEIRQGEVFVSGKRLQEPYLQAHDLSEMSPIRLKDKEYFVLGDNRPSSNDSRNWGAVPEGLIVGKAWFVYWPPSKWHPLSLSSSWLTAP
ncbi:MAG: signal peptidase I [SAR202 cluster bacterium]|nr:signal peptidase I [SAR202 cluster bacterium]